MTMPTLQNIKPRCKCPGCSFWLRLEAERADQSYKQKPEPVAVQKVVEKPKEVVKIIYRDTPQSQERDLMLFNAGRHAAGARDSKAVLAAAQLQSELARSNRE